MPIPIPISHQFSHIVVFRSFSNLTNGVEIISLCTMNKFLQSNWIQILAQIRRTWQGLGKYLCPSLSTVTGTTERGSVWKLLKKSFSSQCLCLRDSTWSFDVVTVCVREPCKKLTWKVRILNGIFISGDFNMFAAFSWFWSWFASWLSCWNPFNWSTWWFCRSIRATVW